MNLTTKHLLIIFIILVGISLRSYDLVNRYGFAADGDLFSWIVRNIVDDKHLRLVGQQTSTLGIFIGPLFYYLLVPFYVLNLMDPVGALYFAVTISALTIISFYFVFWKLFDQVTGIVAVFLQAVLLTRVTHDRWVVPTITTSIWEVWYFFTLVMLLRGNFSVMPLLGLLAALIWHISLSLLPILILTPLAIFLSKKIPKVSDIVKGFLVFTVTSFPLIIFEIKHNFIQTTSLISSFSSSLGDQRSFLDKLPRVFDMAISSLSLIFFYPNQIYGVLQNAAFLILIFVLFHFCLPKGVEYKKLMIILFVWIFSMVFFFIFSSKIISEYYFDNLNMVFLSLAILIFSVILKSKQRWFVLAILGLLLFRSINYIINTNDHNFMGYQERKSVAKFIKEDSLSKGYPCVSVSYITHPGENIGFRYFFYLNNLHVNQPSSGSPNYTIVIPSSLSPDSIQASFGVIGVIPPTDKIDKIEVERSCSGQNANLTDPMLNYVE